MPLAFQSRSHGTVAFGFFNIDIDMLLLERWFFLDAAFCEAVQTLQREGTAQLPGWRIDDPRAIGDLHGAIAGLDRSGFIGATYARFAFPAAPEDFRQSPEGDANNAWAAETMERFGIAETLALAWDRPASTVRLGELTFDLADFGALLRYVDRGGYPRWREGRRPAHVAAMVRALRESGSALWTAARSQGR